MSYINKEDRKLFDRRISSLYRKAVDSDRADIINQPGVLNYIITKIINLWLGVNPNYAKFNAVLGVLQGVTLELYRRRIILYEDKKWRENGDVYFIRKEDLENE